MPWIKKNLNWILIVILLVVVLVTVFTFRNFTGIKNQNPFAQLSNKTLNGASPGVLSGSILPGQSSTQYLNASYAPLSLKDLQKILPTTFPLATPVSQKNTLPLPEVADSEITFDLQGARTTNKYIDELIEIFKSNNFLINPEYAPIFKLDNVGLMLPTEIILQALQENDKTEVKNSLLAWSKLNEDVINEYKKAKINNLAYSVINFSKTVIGVNKLQEELIEKGIAFSDNQINSSEMQAYLDKFIYTVDFYSKKSAIQLQGAANNKSWFFETAHATSSLPFGGMISYVYSCCNGLLLTIGPPGPEGEYMIYWSFLASPLFYQFRATHIGAWLLGLYEPGGTCQTGTYCSTSISAYSIIMTGTSE